MNFLHPQFLWLAPLIAVPIVIHLLNRIRYRRVKWAAIEFLLTSERRAVRRAKLRHLLLMALRTLLLAAALGALAQPILRGSLAALVGSTTQLSVLVDTSASMSVTDASGEAFDRARKMVGEAVESLPHGTRATAGTFSVRYESPFREPLLDRDAVVSVIENAKRTDGASDVPGALRGAAEALKRQGGGGTIWMLTDLQAAGWRANDTGAWEQTRQALAEAGDPAVVISDLSSNVDANFSISEVRTDPAVLVEGDAPKLTAVVRLLGKSGGVTTVSLFLDGRRVDSRVVEMDEPGVSEVAFRLPSLTTGMHAGRVELNADAIPADDRRYFTLRAGGRIPLVVVDGSPSTIPFEGAADFLSLAVQPPEGDVSARSSFEAKTVTLEELPGIDLRGVAAVLVADAPRLSPQHVKVLEDYLQSGGLVMMFPGAHTDTRAWNACALPGVKIVETLEAPENEAFKVNWTMPTGSVVTTLAAEGLDRLAIKRLWRYDPEDARTLASTVDGQPFLVQRQVGPGKLYLWAVSCQADDSNLPFTPVLLLTVHRAVASHLVEVRDPLGKPAFTRLEFPMPTGRAKVLDPSGELQPLLPDPESPDLAAFDLTGRAGIYRLVEGDKTPEASADAPAIAAINPPDEESEIERIDEQTVRDMLSGTRVSVLRSDGGVQEWGTGSGQQSAASSFPLAAIAVALLLSEVVLGWLLDKPANRETDSTGSVA